MSISLLRVVIVLIQYHYELSISFTDKLILLILSLPFTAPPSSSDSDRGKTNRNDAKLNKLIKHDYYYDMTMIFKKPMVALMVLVTASLTFVKGTIDDSPSEQMGRLLAAITNLVPPFLSNFCLTGDGVSRSPFSLHSSAVADTNHFNLRHEDRVEVSVSFICRNSM